MYGVIGNLAPITSKPISQLHARKHYAIWENLPDKWPTVSLPFTTFKACLSMGLLKSRLATSFAPIDMASKGLDKHDIHAQLM